MASSGEPLRFAAICLLPIGAIAGLFAGGAWNWLGCAAYFLLYVFADNLAPADRGAPATMRSRHYDALLFAQVPLVLTTWFGFMLAFSRESAATWELLGAGASAVFTFAISGTVTAHELVHRTSSPASMLAGRVLLAFIFDAAFSVEHVYGHHARVGTLEDGATARRGENLYAFFWRSSIQSFRGAWRIERERLQRRGRPLWSWHNRNLRGIAMSVTLVAITYLVSGWAAAAAFIAVGAAAKLVLEMINYVEHYGLVRVPGEPVLPRHSWDTAAPISAIGMFNLGRHAAHHVKAGQPYWALALPDAPQMPVGLPLTAIIATVPPLWFRVMGRRLKRWDRQMASAGELALLRAQAD